MLSESDEEEEPFQRFEDKGDIAKRHDGRELGFNGRKVEFKSKKFDLRPQPENSTCANSI